MRKNILWNNPTFCKVELSLFPRLLYVYLRQFLVPLNQNLKLMNCWLIKSEPEAFSYQDLEKDGVTMWDGVRNYAARNNLRAMKTGDLALFYHSLSDKAIVGVCKVSKEHYPDPTATSGDWSVVDFVPVKTLTRPLSLAAIKADPVLQELPLIRNSRLSVMPVTREDFDYILEITDTSL